MADYDEPPPNMQGLSLSDSPPSRTPTSRQQKPLSANVDPEARDAALRAELAGVQQINKVIEGVIGSLEKARANMETVASTVNNANTLLNLWIRILSQTEHTQRLLLSGHWEGATKDLADIEAEALARAQEAERRREEERLRAAARERERAAAAAAREAGENRPPSRSGRGGYGRVRGRVGIAGGTTGGTSRIPAGSASSSAETARGRGLPRGLRRGGGRLGSAGRGTGKG
ncbi:DASH complex subunit Duo1-domain-containing protein [Kalaharituber pfeilii]|nr:DASH complex subunit Duo1-domain-containing protein [Kalaharituber pfeilii]